MVVAVNVCMCVCDVCVNKNASMSQYACGGHRTTILSPAVGSES